MDLTGDAAPPIVEGSALVRVFNRVSAMDSGVQPSVVHRTNPIKRPRRRCHRRLGDARQPLISRLIAARSSTASALRATRVDLPALRIMLWQVRRLAPHPVRN